MTDRPTFPPEQLRAAYDRYAQSRWPSDAHRQAAAMDLLGPHADDDAIERLAAEIGRAVEEVHK
ncbi:hypothetical protein Q0601_17760 [Paracoccus onubensis]|uniref:hypothetical protein n=1 Tax=Paracoccus onubensis TaxID=1675788 RepID=UPI00272F1AB9|nr:hypothetical protein [Paracoccus onubensis]MDP0929035.1 hypothetical protein [Paracoccus onubensis]